MSENRSRVFSMKIERPRWQRFDLENPVLTWGLALLFLGALYLVLTAEFRPAGQALTEDDVGTIADREIRADRDFVYSRVDHETTQRIREERAAAAPLVYRWHADGIETVRKRIAEAFGYMQAGITQEIAKYDTAARPLPPKARVMVEALNAQEALSGGAGEGALGLAVPKERATEELKPVLSLDETLVTWSVENREEFDRRLLEYVDDETYALLVKQRFSFIAEEALLQLLGELMAQRIVQSMDEVEGQREIIVHTFKGRELVGEERLDKLNTLVDIEALVDTLDDRSRHYFPTWSPSDRQAISRLAKQFIQPNMQLDAEATEQVREEAINSVADLVIQRDFQRDEIIVDNGREITAEHVAIYQAMVGDQAGSTMSYIGRIGLLAFLLVTMLSFWLFMRGPWRTRRRWRRDLLFFCVSLLTMLVLVRTGEAVLATVAAAWQVQLGTLIILLLPYAAGSLMMRLVQDRQSAVVFTLVLSLLIGVSTPDPSIIIPFCLISGVVGTVVLKHASTRMAILRAGALLGLVGAVSAVGLVIYQNESLETSDYLLAAALAFSGGLLAAIIVTVSMPIIESLFGYTTNIKLLELANLDHPALKDLLLEAPGTYHHSMMVGSLTEAAAKAVGANAILARVGAYYHDIGKMRNAQYYAENQLGENPHNKLKPNMSALILKSHVKDGIELAKKYMLPSDIIAFIATHHGTSRIEYFYHKAKELESPDIPEVREEDYRYPGPRPQSRETGICMIADVVEAAARSLPEKTSARLKLLVHKLINDKFADGQFDECALTLRDLNAIAEAMLRILNAVYHKRPEYPAQKRERERRERLAREKQNSPDPASTSTHAIVERAVEAARSLKNEEAKSSADASSIMATVDPIKPVGRARSDHSQTGKHHKVEAPSEEGSAAEKRS